MPTTQTTTFQNTMLQPAQTPDEARTYPVRLPGGVDYPAGQVLGEVSAAAANDVQTVTITGTPTGGSFRLVFNGVVSGAIAYNAAAAAVQAALEAMSNIGTGNVACTGGALPGTPVVCTFQGALANRKVPLMTTINSLTGGTNPAVAVAQTTSGTTGPGQFAAYNDAAADGTQVAKAILQRRARTNEAGQLMDEHGVGLGTYHAVAYFAGTFYTAELTGLDANGVADLGRLIQGNTSALSAAKTLLRMG